MSHRVRPHIGPAGCPHRAGMFLFLAATLGPVAVFAAIMAFLGA
ncbi:hypothetical protein [Sandarakinorhabdus glacialis]|nr:hypothetical protein [Polymorphobacter glacialis]